MCYEYMTVSNEVVKNSMERFSVEEKILCVSTKVAFYSNHFEEKSLIQSIIFLNLRTSSKIN